MSTVNGRFGARGLNAAPSAVAVRNDENVSATLRRLAERVENASGIRARRTTATRTRVRF